MKHPAPRLRLTLAIAAATALSLGSGATAHAQARQNAVTRAGDFSETTGKTESRNGDRENTATSEPPDEKASGRARGSQNERVEDESLTNGSTTKNGPNKPPTSGSPRSPMPDGAPTSAPQDKSVPDAFDAFPKAAAKKPIRGRAVSPSVAAQLAVRMPKYEEPKPAAPEPEEEPADLRDIDKPQNQILRLPDYVVREKKPAILRTDDLYRGDSRAALAKQHYFSETSLALNRFELPLFGSGAGAYALRRYEEDERLRHLGELSATASDIGQLSGSTETEADLRHLIRDTYFRSGTRSDDYNGYRKPD